MCTSSQNMICRLAFIGVLVATSAAAEPTSDQLTGQATGNYQAGDEPDSTLEESPRERLDAILRDYAYLDRHFQLMDEFGVEEKLQASADALRKNKKSAEDLMRLYKLLAEASTEDNGYFGEARWRALHVLGELRDKRAAEFLFDIAVLPMPSSKRVDEVQYKSEYRLRARAIDGLEKLGQTDLLRRIYDEKGLLSGLAAASLYELDAAPAGIEFVDGRKVFGLGDPTDYNPPRGQTADKLPQGLPERPSKTDDVPAISPGIPNVK